MFSSRPPLKGVGHPAPACSTTARPDQRRQPRAPGRPSAGTAPWSTRAPRCPLSVKLLKKLAIACGRPGQKAWKQMMHMLGLPIHLLPPPSHCITELHLQVTGTRRMDQKRVPASLPAHALDCMRPDPGAPALRILTDCARPRWQAHWLAPNGWPQTG